MTEEIIIAGFGGQGVLSMGKILAYAGVMGNKEVSWIPSYGPEMRGGTANVTVIISDERISSPIVNFYDTAIILNQQSMDKFESTVKPGGLLIYDGNGITHHPERKDINIYRVDANDEAARRGILKVFNMIVLGGYLKLKPVVSSEFMHKGLEKSLPKRHHGLIPDNEKAIDVGKEIIYPVHVLKN
jgi:2-oxoglutarate ferredoxin oxidoreductase subunit gamma